MTTYNKGDRLALNVTIACTMEPDSDGEVLITLPGRGSSYVLASALRPWTPPPAPEEPSEFGTNVLVEPETFVLLAGYEDRPFRLVTGSGWYSWQKILDLAAERGEQIKVVTPEQVRSL